MAVVQHPAIARPEQPTISVCIANYNGEQLLADCIDSVLAQAGDTLVEIIVHDDASSDASLALLSERYPQVELLASEDNVGFCIANNRMVAHARGEYVLLLNNDAALFPDALATLLAAAQEQDVPGILTLPQYDWATGNLVDRGCLLDPFYNPVPNFDPQRRDVAMVIGACLWIPRSLWQELGGFPEWFGSIAEDMYLCCHARLRMRPVEVANASGYRHRQGQSFGGNRTVKGRLHSTYNRRSLSERNKTTVMMICTPTLLVWPLLAIHVVLLSLEGLALSAVKKDRQIWLEIYYPAVRYTTSSWRTLQSIRTEYQRTRKSGVIDYLHAFAIIPRKLVLLSRHGIPKIS